VVGTFDRQLVRRVIVHHLSDTVEWLAELSQNEPAVGIRYYLHMHEAGRTPVGSVQIQQPPARCRQLNSQTLISANTTGDNKNRHAQSLLS